jgi:radical SAM/Cys-rich protein
MDWPTMEVVLTAAKRTSCSLVDLTGGAPELNKHFPQFVSALCRAGYNVQVRTNLTVMLEAGMEGLAEFLADHRVRLVASMPCYLQQNVDAQRGQGVYQASVKVIQRLNRLGYGRQAGLELNLIYNAAGPILPPDQAQLEADYRRELRQRFDIEFSRLLAITNMPIGRFGKMLRQTSQYGQYIALLSQSFNAQTVEGLMCRRQISIGWDGTLYDCDFNLALGCPVNHGAPDRLQFFDQSALMHRRIVTGQHCFGCTAGAGSSCVGALAR